MKMRLVRLLGFLLLMLCVTGNYVMAIGHRQIAGHVQYRYPALSPSPSISVPAFIDVYKTDGEWVTRAFSDDNGYFVMPALKPTDYVVIASAITPDLPGGRLRPSFPITVNLRKSSDVYLDCYLVFQSH